MSSAARSATADVGSGSALLLAFRGLLADRTVRATRSLVGCASGFLCSRRRGLGCAFLRTEVFGQVIQHSLAIGVGDDGAEAFHFFQLFGPLLSGQVLLGDAAGVMARSASGLHFGLHRSGRKRFAWSAGRLPAGQDDGCEQKDCEIYSLEQNRIPSQFSVLKNLDVFRGLWLLFFWFSLRC